MRKKHTILTLTLVLITTLLPTSNSMRAAQDVIDVSHPLQDLFFNETTIPITPDTDETGQQIYTLRVPVPHYYQAMLIWKIGFANDPPITPLKSAIESGHLASLNVKFVDQINGELAFIGMRSPSPSPPVGLDRYQAEELLLRPMENLKGNYVVAAAALVSAPSLNIQDEQVFLDGYISSPFDTVVISAPPSPGPPLPPPPSPTQNQIRQEFPSMAQDQQQVKIENCVGDQRTGACATPTPGAFCPVRRAETVYTIECYVDGEWRAGVPSLERPNRIGGNCRLKVSRTYVTFYGQCNSVGRGGIIFRRRREYQCLCVTS